MARPGSGGLPARRPDQQPSPPPAAQSPGAAAGILRARIIIISGTGEGLFIYSGKPAAGNQPILSATSGTKDPYGNTVIPVLEVQGADGVISVTAPAVIQFPSGASFEQAIANLVSGVGGTSPAQFIQLLISSASTTTAGAHDQVQIEMNSAAADNSSYSNLELVYVGSNSNRHEYVYMDATGFNIVAGLITAAHPGTTPAVAETRQSAAAGNSWSGTVFYELTGTGRVEIVAQLTAPSSAVNSVTIVTLPAGYRPSTGIEFGVAASALNAGDATGAMILGSDGTLSSRFIAASATVWVGPIQIPLDL